MKPKNKGRRKSNSELQQFTRKGKPHRGKKKNQTQRELPWADLDAGDKFLTISRGRALIYSDQ